MVTDALVMSFSLLAVLLWLILYTWYSVFDHYLTPGFAFDKVPGRFASPTLRYTAVLFLGISLLYFANCWLIGKASTISRAIKLATIVHVVGAGIANILI